MAQKKPSASSKPEKAAESRKDRQDRQRIASRRKEKTVAPEKGGKEKGGRVYTRRLTQEMKKIIAARGKRGTDDEAQIKKLLELSHRVSNLIICIFDEHIQMHTHTHFLSLSLSLSCLHESCAMRKKQTWIRYFCYTLNVIFLNRRLTN